METVHCQTNATQTKLASVVLLFGKAKINSVPNQTSQGKPKPVTPAANCDKISEESIMEWGRGNNRGHPRLRLSAIPVRLTFGVLERFQHVWYDREK